MYGPVEVSWVTPKFVGACLSSGATTDCGTGAEPGRDRAWTTVLATVEVRWITSVVEFGVWIPEIGPPLALAAPTIAFVKYELQ